MSSKIACNFLRRIAVPMLVLLCASAWAEESERGAHWVTAWGTSQQPNVTAATISNATVRMIARVTLPGDTIRIRLDNTFSSAPVTIGRASVGHRVQGALLAAGSSQQVFFNGSPSVTIPAGGSVPSDAIALAVQMKAPIYVNESVLEEVTPNGGMGGLGGLGGLGGSMDAGPEDEGDPQDEKE